MRQNTTLLVIGANAYCPSAPGGVRVGWTLLLVDRQG
jgi:hypothetical protein